MDPVELFAQTLLTGLYISSKYVYVAIGLTLIFGVMDLADFAQGALFMLGALLIYYIADALGLSYFSALVLVIGSLALCGVGTDLLVYKRLRGFEINSLIAALGILMIIENIATFLIGGKYLAIESPFGDAKFIFGQNVIISAQEVALIAGSFLSIIIVWTFLQKTRTGKALRAMSQNREAAALMGVNINNVSMLTFAIAAGLAGFDGALTAPTQVINPTMGISLILKAFAITVLGGMGSIPGAIAGSFIVGYAEVFTSSYISATYSIFVAFFIMLLMMLFKPEGLFGD